MPFYTVWVFLVYYSTAVVHINRSAVLLGVVIVNFILLGATILGGLLSDRIGRRSTFLVGVLLMAVFAYPLFWMTNLGEPHWLWLAMLMFGTPFWFVWGVLPAYFYEFFPAQVRYTGISVGSQAATIIGGLVPLFATALCPLQDLARFAACHRDVANSEPGNSIHNEGHRCATVISLRHR